MRKKSGVPKGQVSTPKAIPHQFKPGQSGNPSGRPKMTAKQKILKELTVKSFQECAEAVCTGNTEDLKRMIDDENVSALQVGIATSLLVAIREGNYAVVREIVQTVTGKPPEELIINSRNTNLNANVNANLDETKVKAALQKIGVDV